MASGTLPPSQAAPPPGQAAASYEAWIDSRLQVTGRQVKTVEVASALGTLLAAALAYLLAAAMLDHWALPRGLGFQERLLFWLVMVVAGTCYLVCRVLPLLVFRISPLFAAQAIEQGRPSFKNSLLNFLFLRRQRHELARDELTRRILQGLEYQAAAGLSQVPPEAAVDRSGLLRSAYFLAGLVSLCCVYLVLSPKSPLVSFGRVIWPWARLPAPTRVKIEAVQPGDTAAYQGDTIAVSAEVHGLRPGEPVKLLFSSADGHSVDQVIPMKVPPDGYRYQAELPPGGLGLQQDLQYWLTAGDCSTERFRVEMQIPLAIVVDRVQYEYPAYTGLPPRTVHNEGDLRAIEGTRVTIHATANQPIDQAAIYLDGDRPRAFPMDSEGRSATGRLVLRVSPEDPGRSEYVAYHVRFTDPQRRENRRPNRHRIEVIPDQKPEVRFLLPAESEVAVSETGWLELKVRAEDPDFGLRRVALLAERAAGPLQIPPLLELPSPRPAHQGVFEKSYRFEPARWGLRAGDRVTYWAEAADNKEFGDDPAPNVVQTQRRSIRIVPADHQRPGESQEGQGRPAGGAQKESRPAQDPQPQAAPADQQARPDQKRPEPQQGKPESPPPSDGQNLQPTTKQQTEQPQQPGETPEQSPAPAPDQQAQSDAQAREDSSDASRQAGGQKGQSGAQSRQQPEAPPEPVNPDTEPGEAIQRILQYREELEQEGQTETGPQPKPAAQVKPEPGGAAQEAPGPEGSSQTSQPEGAMTEQTPAERPGDQQPTAAKPTAGDKPPERQTQVPPKALLGGETPGDSERTGSHHQQQSGKPQAPDEKQPSAPEGILPRAEQPPAGKKGQPETSPAAPDSRHASPWGTPQPKGATGAPEPRKSQAAGEVQPEPQTGEPRPGQGPGGMDQQPAQRPSPPRPQGGMTPGPDRPEDHRPEGPAERGLEPPPTSPAVSPKPSKIPSDTPGDRSAAGQPGGAQEDQQEGAGKPGQQTPSDTGEGPATEQAPGAEMGHHPGEQTKAGGPAGPSATKERGEGTAQKQPGEEEPPGGAPKQSDRSTGSAAKPVSEPGGPTGGKEPPGVGGSSSGRAGRGGLPGQAGRSEPLLEPPAAAEADEPNLQFARERTDLALRTLEEELARGRPRLLERLGWDRATAERFLRQWKDLATAAQEQGPRGAAAKQDLDKLLKSLGLRPQSTRGPASRTPKDQLQSVDPGRFAPPPEWKELFEAYTRGLGSGKP
ncbi:MAG: hypothetical protein ACUVUC_01330 [Thermoguttaceae bacterium]